MQDHVSVQAITDHNTNGSCINPIADGYVDVEEILELHEASNKSEDDVRRIVKNDGKKRFSLKEGLKLQIKATQGHSIKVRHYTLHSALFFWFY